MIRRAATVVWWIGALCIAGGLIGAFSNQNPSEIGLCILMGGIGAAFFMSIAYIMAGSFLRPAEGPLSRRP